MKRRLLTLIGIALLAAAMGCAAGRFAEDTLVPLAARVLENVQPFIALGVEDGVADGDLSQEQAEFVLAQSGAMLEALRRGDLLAALAVDWYLLEKWATRGVMRLVDEGKVSQGAATLLLQRIVNLRDLLNQLGQPASLGWTNARPIYDQRLTVGGKPTFVRYATPITTELEAHNRPRRALGLPLLEEAPGK